MTADVAEEYVGPPRGVFTLRVVLPCCLLRLVRPHHWRTGRFFGLLQILKSILIC